MVPIVASIVVRPTVAETTVGESGTPVGRPLTVLDAREAPVEFSDLTVKMYV